MEVMERISAEDRAWKRIQSYKRAIKILVGFFELGFKNYGAIKSIVFYYRPEANEEHLRALWNLKNINDPLCDILEHVLEQLKNE
jgi:hypothetical protein